MIAFRAKRIHTLCSTVLHWCRWEMMQCTLQLTCLAGPFSALAKRTKSLHTQHNATHCTSFRTFKSSTQHSVLSQHSDNSFRCSFFFEFCIYLCNKFKHSHSTVTTQHGHRIKDAHPKPVLKLLLLASWLYSLFSSWLFFLCALFTFCTHGSFYAST